jgi:hypothetical protein
MIVVIVPGASSRRSFGGIPIVATFRLLSFEGLMADVQWRSAWLTGELQVAGGKWQVAGINPKET